VPARKIRERINHLAAAHSQGTPSPKKKRNVGTKACCHSESFGWLRAVAGQAFQAEKRSRGIAAGASQPRAGGNSLHQLDANPAPESSCPPPELARPIDQVVPPHGNRWVVALDNNPSAPPGEGNLEAVVQGHSLKNGADLVVAVGPFPDNLQAEVNLGKSADSEA